jgi:hypothetical protein
MAASSSSGIGAGGAATLPALCSAWAGAVAARAGTALVGSASVLQDASLSSLNPTGSPFLETVHFISPLNQLISVRALWLSSAQLIFSASHFTAFQLSAFVLVLLGPEKLRQGGIVEFCRAPLAWSYREP